MQRLLLIDDEPIFARVLARALLRFGYDCAIAHDIESALQQCQTEQTWAGVILDLKLGVESGLHALPLFRAQLPETPILMLTGYASIATTVEAIKLGAINYLPKPSRVEAILSGLGLLQTEGSPSDAPAALNDDENEDATNKPLSLRRLEWEQIQRVLQENDGNLSATARALNLHRRSLQRKLQKHAPT